ncbi:MAG: IPT/TIG domain-containing protein [Actinobacteria bacterium]|nr:IPT/TIG domain-containing protein [Actinomycetota bacterium]
MRGKPVIGRIAVVACIAIALSLLPIATAPSAAATWTRAATDGIGNSNNVILIPGETFQGKLSIYSTPLIGITPAGPATLNMYDGNQFTTVGTPGFGDPNNKGLESTAVYRDELYIGSANGTTGGELFRWSGTGDPVKVPESANGWGEGQYSDTIFPVGVINDQLLIAVNRSSAPADTGLRMYSYNGSTWTKVVGPGAPVSAGLGDAGNVAAFFGRELNGKLYFPVVNVVTGVQVWSYEGSNFKLEGNPASLWGSDNFLGMVMPSPAKNLLYLGTGNYSEGGELWSFDGQTWTLTKSGGIEGAYDFFIQPLPRGEDLYVATTNPFAGCRVYKMEGNSFTPISDPGFQAYPDTTNVSAFIYSINGKIVATTGKGGLVVGAEGKGRDYSVNNGFQLPGGEVWTTPIAPTIDRLVFDYGPYGAVIDIQGHDFLSEQGNGYVTFNGVKASEIISWSDTSIKAVVPPKAASGPVQVIQSNGDSNKVNFTVTLSKTWYFAEGTTRANNSDGSFEEYICIQNPQDADAQVQLTYMFGDGTTQKQDVTVPKKARRTVNVNEAVGKDKDVSTFIQSDQLILAERPMYFNYRDKWKGGHTGVGVPDPRKTWYFAEGSTRNNTQDGSFEEWLCIQNPGSGETTVNVTYMLGTGQTVQKSYKVGPTTRRTIDVNLELGPDKDVSILVEGGSPIVAERPMYFDYHSKWAGGHNAVGAQGPDTSFYFPEGTTRDNGADGSFEEWICIQNPGSIDAGVKITYWTAKGTNETQDVTVAAHSRSTVDVNQRLGDNKDVSSKVESNVPVLVERPIYFNYHDAWAGGDDGMGCPEPKTKFYFAEGNTLDDFVTYITILNPQTSAASIKLTFMVEGETQKEVLDTIQPSRRYTKDVSTLVGKNKSFSILVESDKPVVAERPMYFNYHGWCPGGHTTMGYGI